MCSSRSAEEIKDLFVYVIITIDIYFILDILLFAHNHDAKFDDDSLLIIRFNLICFDYTLLLSLLCISVWPCFLFLYMNFVYLIFVYFDKLDIHIQINTIGCLI